MKEIPLTQGYVALVDDEDYERLSMFPWHISSRGYAVRNSRGSGKELMHRALMGNPTGREIDHINRNRLDNQKSNLRLSTHRENCCNQEGRSITSQYKGVCWVKRCNKWQAQINVNKKTIFLGLFEHDIDAARAYDKAAKQHQGVFAYLNFKEEI